MSQITNKNDPVRFLDPFQFPTPKGYRRVKAGEPLCEGDLFLHCGLFKWMPCNVRAIQENYFTNCIRLLKPIALLAEKCS